MTTISNEYEDARSLLASAAWQLYDDLGLNVIQFREGVRDADHWMVEALDPLEEAWVAVDATRDDMMGAILHLDPRSIQAHGLYGAELELKIRLWIASRARLSAELEQGSDIDYQFAEQPEYIEPIAEPLPTKKARRPRVARTLGLISKALGHADNWLESLISALGQHERFKEIKETVERGTGDVADELGRESDQAPF